MSLFQKNKGFEGLLYGIRILIRCSHFYLHGDNYSEDHPTQDIIISHFHLCNILIEHVYAIIFILVVMQA